MSSTGIFVFDYGTWILRYPEFQPTVNDVLAELYFTEAQIYLNNTACSLVSDVAQRGVLLNMLVAHIASLAQTSAASGGGAGIVGRINSATQGSVSVGSDLTGIPGSAAWFSQTPYGFAYWQATAAYRTMRYKVGNNPYLGVSGFGAGLGARWHRYLG